MNSDSGMLYSIVLKLVPTREATVRATMGHQAHAAFLLTVRESDPALAEVLHTPNMPVRNAHLSGRFYRLKDGTLLPLGMRFGVERLR